MGISEKFWIKLEYLVLVIIVSSQLNQLQNSFLIAIHFKKNKNSYFLKMIPDCEPEISSFQRMPCWIIITVSRSYPRIIELFVSEIIYM